MIIDGGNGTPLSQFNALRDIQRILYHLLGLHLNRNQNIDLEFFKTQLLAVYEQLNTHP